MNIKLINYNTELIPPSRKHYNDAGLDCYVLEDITLEPFTKKLNYKIPLGFGLELPDGYVAIIKPRSSINQQGVITYEGIIDSGYRGEISAIFSNLSDKPITFKQGDRICQILIMPISIGNVVVNLGKERESGGFGSTGA